MFRVYHSLNLARGNIRIRGYGPRITSNALHVILTWIPEFTTQTPYHTDATNQTPILTQEFNTQTPTHLTTG